MKEECVSTDDEKDLDRRNSSDMHGMVGPLDAEMPTADAHPVVMDNFNFTPATISVPVGTTVKWTNRDDVPHNVVSTEQKFKSPVLDTDEQFSHRFDTPGAYKYFCSIHPKMTGRIVVG